MPNLFIGTSGWVYKHWEGLFYPKETKEKLSYYAQFFNTVEINYSYYRLPSSSAFQKWYQETPEDFLFSLKLNRYLTHIKRLKNIDEAWFKFIDKVSILKNKLGPILVQLPPNFKYNQTTFKRIESFLRLVGRFHFTNFQNSILLAFEVRHSSFKNQEFYKLLQKYHTALVVSDSSRWERIIESDLTDFVYLRMHGPKELFASNYSKKELNNFAQEIKRWLRNGLDVYCYFNNDIGGYALSNAQDLKEMIWKE